MKNLKKFWLHMMKTLELPIDYKKHDNKPKAAFCLNIYLKKFLFCFKNIWFSCNIFLYFSPSLSTPRGRPWRTSSWSSSTPAPRWVTDDSKRPRTKWPSWDPSKRMLPRQNPLHKYFPIIYFTEKIMFKFFLWNQLLAAYFPSIKQLHVGNIWWILKKKHF